MSVLVVPGILSSYTFIRNAPTSWCHLEISYFFLKEICLINVVPLVFWGLSLLKNCLGRIVCLSSTLYCVIILKCRDKLIIWRVHFKVLFCFCMEIDTVFQATDLILTLNKTSSRLFRDISGDQSRWFWSQCWPVLTAFRSHLALRIVLSQ